MDLGKSPEFPRQQPIRLVVTFPPGGSADAVVRMLAPRLVGAAGALAANSSLYDKMPFDPLKDFRPVSMLAAIPFVIVGHPSLAAKTQPELLALARAKPGKLCIGHGGNGTAMHLSAALFAQLAQVKLVEVPYKGSGPAALEVLAGNVPLAMVDLPAALQHIRAGKLSAEINVALGDEQIKANMRTLGVEPAPSRPAAFEVYIRAETQKWARVIQQANIKIDP